MTPIAPSPRHPWEELLAELTGRSGLRHGWGTEDDAKTAPTVHVTWIAGAPTFEARRFNIPGAVVSEVLVVDHEVHIYGGSPVSVLTRAKDLVGQLDALAGPRQGDPLRLPPRPGYNVRAKGKPIKGGAAGGEAWLVVLVVTLKDFALRQYNPLGTVAAGVDVTTTVLKPDGTVPTGDPLQPLEVP